MTDESMALLEPVEKHGEGDFLRELGQATNDRLSVACFVGRRGIVPKSHTGQGSWRYAVVQRLNHGVASMKIDGRLMGVTTIVAVLAALVQVASAEADPRTKVMLSADHRAAVLGEMRQYVAGLQAITGALANDDMDTVAAEANALGKQMMRGAPRSMITALPVAFRKLGMSVHADFDRLALDARDLGDPQHALRQLSAVLGKCVACHAAYRIELTQ